MKPAAPHQRSACRLVTMLFDPLAVFLAFRLCLRLVPAGSVVRAIPPMWVVLPLWHLVFRWAGMYEDGRNHSPVARVKSVLKGTACGTVALIMLVFFLGDSFGPRAGLTMCTLFVLSAGLLALSRMLASWVTEGHRTASENVAFLGSIEDAGRLMRALGRADGSSTHVVGVIGTSVRSFRADHGLTFLGTTAQLPQIINRHHIHRLYITENRLSDEDLLLCVGTCQKMSVRLGYLLDVVGLSSSRLTLTAVNGVPVLEIDVGRRTSWQQRFKRAFDVAAVLLTAPLWLPLLAAAALAVRLGSPGPIFYTSLRVGRGGRFFRFLKFRTMQPDGETRLAALRERNEKSGHLFKVRNDPRVTRVGRFLRRSSLDELPQLINVLLGDMSLVGPRPLPVDTFEPDGESPRFSWWSRQRHAVLPGITGLWQVSGRSDLSFKEMVALDLEYVEDGSLAKDLGILLRTAPAVLHQSGAC